MGRREDAHGPLLSPVNEAPAPLCLSFLLGQLGRLKLHEVSVQAMLGTGLPTFNLKVPRPPLPGSALTFSSHTSSPLWPPPSQQGPLSRSLSEEGVVEAAEPAEAEARRPHFLLEQMVMFQAAVPWLELCSNPPGEGMEKLASFPSGLQWGVV